jgi:hypothetical protein
MKKKKTKYVGTNPITGKKETKEQRDSRLRSSDYPKDKSPQHHH